MNYDYGYISFPGLGIDYIDINPVAFKVFGLEIKWYAICILVGVVLAVLYAMRNCERFGITKDNIIDIALIGLPVSIIGARAYYVIFSLSDHVYNSFWDVINIRGGGLAIYGAVIAAFLAGLIYSKFAKISFLSLFDVGALGFLIGQSVGRIGNFINQEAYGGITNLPWRMEITVGYDRIAVHPTFLYELLWNLVGFIALHFISKKRRFNGEIFFLYVAWYGLGRFWIEGLRTDSLMAGPLRMSQVLAGVSCVLAIAAYVYMTVRTLKGHRLVLEPVQAACEGNVESPAESTLFGSEDENYVGKVIPGDFAEENADTGEKADDSDGGANSDEAGENVDNDNDQSK